MPIATNSLENRRALCVWICAILLAVSTVVIADTSSAAEPWRQFLDGLRQRGLHDMAIIYLDRMADDPRCPADLRTVLDYESGITLMSSSRSSPFLAQREKALDDARVRFDKFLAEHPDHELASLAASHSANLWVERGRLRIDFAERGSTLPVRKKQLLAEACKYYTKAREAFETARLRYADELKKAKALPKQEGSAEKQSHLQSDLLSTRLFLATADYEIGMTYPADNPQRRKRLVEAAKQYHDIYNELVEQRSEPLLAGFQARLLEGRCYRQIGQNKKALTIFDELIETVDDSPTTHDLINQTYAETLETLVQPKVHRYDAATKVYQRWEKTVRGSDLTNAEGLTIQCLAAEAFLEQARKLPKDQFLDRKEMLKKAWRLLRAVSRSPGKYQARAKTKLLDPLLAKSHDQTAEPTNFATARDKADTAKDQMQAAELQIQLDRRTGKTENRKQNERKLAESRDEAIKYYRMALGLATAETPIDQINMARYYLAYLYWSRHDRYDAAVLGQYVAQRYPESAIAPRAAKIAMVAYAELYNQSPTGEAKQFAQQHMMAVASYMTERWPSGPEAADAWIMLVHTAVLDGKMETAQKYVEKLPADSPRRGEAELMIGRAYWADWVRTVQSNPDAVDSESVRKKLDHARDMLASGVKQMASAGTIDTSLVAAVHALVQIHLRQDQLQAALKLLDDPTVGLMTLARAKHPAVMQKNYDVEVYKTALRVYVAAQRLDEAEKIMDTLEKRAKADTNARKEAQLTKIYLALGRELQDVLEQLRRQNRTEELAAVSRGFQRFLERLAKRKQGNSFASMAWIAGIYTDMAQRFDTNKTQLTADAAEYYRQAADIYERMLAKSKSQTDFAPSRRALDSVKVRLAQCLRRLGRFSDAMKLLVDVLQHHNRMVDAQVEAAYTYQDWASRSDKTSKYLEAMKGGYPARRKDGSRVNIVWGWGKLANLVFRSKSRRALFYEARYNLARCRFEYAQTLSGSEKVKMLALAAKDITVTQLLSHELGGPKQRREFDLLLKKIQSLQGKEPTALSGKQSSRQK